MTDDNKTRLYEEHQQRVKDLGQKIAEDRKAIREAVGFGGEELTTDEQLQTFLAMDTSAHTNMIQRFQAKYPDWMPTDVSKNYLRYCQHMQGLAKKRGLVA